MKYRPELDGLRAISVLAVMAFHAKVPGVMRGGFLGVDVFFVLSGYLITSLLLAEYRKTGTVALWAFYGRRLRRLYPALLTMLAVYLVAAPLAFPQHEFGRHLQDAAISALYLSDYARVFDAVPVALGHTWSLAIEEQFYLLWPLLLLGLVRLSARQAIGVLVVLILAATAWRWINVLGDEGSWRSFYNRFDTHASGLLIGCLAGYVAPKLTSRATLYGFGGLGLALIMFRFDHLNTAVTGFTLAELSAVMVVLAPPAWLGVAPLAWAGRLSYGLYLWHFPIMMWMRDQGWSWPATFVVGSCLTLAASWFSYQFIECWFRKRTPAADGDLAVQAEPQPAGNA